MKKYKIALPYIEGDYSNYINALTAAGFEPVPVSSVSAEGLCDALLLPGGADLNPALYGEELNGSREIDDALDALQLGALEKYCAAGKPVLGICRGHQLINAFFGGSLYQHIPAADSHSRVNGIEQFHGVSIKSGTYLAALYGQRTTVNSSHHQGIKTAGRGIEIIAAADDGTVEAAVHETLPVISVQWHPERMSGADGGRADGTRIFDALREMIKSQSR